jgi:hypothetical protein
MRNESKTIIYVSKTILKKKIAEKDKKLKDDGEHTQLMPV